MLNIRAMEEKDIPQVEEIEKRYFHCRGQRSHFMMHAVMKIIYILSVKMKAQLPDTADYGRCLVRGILRIWQFILITEKRYRNDAYGRDGKTWNTEKSRCVFSGSA